MPPKKSLKTKKQKRRRNNYMASLKRRRDRQFLNTLLKSTRESQQIATPAIPLEPFVGSNNSDLVNKANWWMRNKSTAYKLMGTGIASALLGYGLYSAKKKYVPVLGGFDIDFTGTGL